MYAVIMAGGVGTRFWPRSRRKRPKQLLPISGPDREISDVGQDACSLPGRLCADRSAVAGRFCSRTGNGGSLV